MNTWLIIFIVSAVVVISCGIKMAQVSEHLAEKTGLGQAVFGALFLASSTSLPGLITTMSAAYIGNASLAISNGIGSIAAQTTFLAFADLFYKKSNLEHAAASVANLFFVSLLIILLSLILIATVASDMTIFHISPFSIIMITVYVAGFKLSQNIEKKPMWRPVKTEYTNLIEEGQESSMKSKYLVPQFVFLALMLAVGGYILSLSGDKIATHYDIPDSFMGAAVMGVITSLPELVTTITATIRGALVLAVSNIVGGNAFDSLFVAVGDLLYVEGSIYQNLLSSDLLLIYSAILLTGVLGMGLIVREKYGFKKIGFESVLMLIIYTMTIGILIGR